MCLVTNSGHSRQIWQVFEVYFILLEVRYVDLVFRAVLILHSFISSAGVQESQLSSDVDKAGVLKRAVQQLEDKMGL